MLTSRRNLSAYRRVRDAVLDRDEYTCRYCGGPADTVDHIIPVAHREDNSMENLVAACMPCNSIASDFVFDSIEAKREFILTKRNSGKWKKRLSRVRSQCTCCQKVFKPRTNGATLFLCPECAKVFC